MNSNFKLLSAGVVTLLVLASFQPQGAFAQAPQPGEPAPETRLIQINLLAASKTGDSELADLPANARKAVEDIKDFLPFKSYKIIDTSLVRSVVVRPPHLDRSARTYLTGPDGSKLAVSVRMSAEQDSTEIFVNEFSVVSEAQDRFQYQALTPEQQRQVDPDSPALATGSFEDQLLISTTFTAHLGQTVVVGSSRLNGGDDALVVLFTALP